MLRLMESSHALSQSLLDIWEHGRKFKYFNSCHHFHQKVIIIYIYNVPTWYIQSDIYSLYAQGIWNLDKKLSAFWTWYKVIVQVFVDDSTSHTVHWPDKDVDPTSTTWIQHWFNAPYLIAACTNNKWVLSLSLLFFTDARVKFYLDAYSEQKDVLNALSFAESGGRTNTQAALELAADEVRLSLRTPSAQLLLVLCWASVVDAGPTLHQHWLNVCCLPFEKIYRTQRGEGGGGRHPPPPPPSPTRVHILKSFHLVTSLVNHLYWGLSLVLQSLLKSVFSLIAKLGGCRYRKGLHHWKHDSPSLA